MNVTREEAYKLRAIIEQAVTSLDDKTALEAVTLYPTWAAGVDYKAGVRVQHIGVLYRLREGQAHTSQADWAPDKTPALWEVVVVGHTGTADDPVPYTVGMALENGKYYAEDGVTYRCTRDTINPVYNPLSALVGLYVEVVE